MAQTTYEDDLDDELDEIALAEARSRGNASGLRIVAGIGGIVALVIEVLATFAILNVAADEWASLESLVIIGLSTYLAIITTGLIAAVYVWTRAMD